MQDKRLILDGIHDSIARQIYQTKLLFQNIILHYIIQISSTTE